MGMLCAPVVDTQFRCFILPSNCWSSERPIISSSTVMLVVIGRQLGLVAPWGELVLLVSVRRSPPDLYVDVTLAMASQCLVVGGKHKQKREEDCASCEDGLCVVSLVSLKECKSL